MDHWELVGSALGTVVFLVWVPSMVLWLRAGVTIPRHIHTLAVVLTSISRRSPSRSRVEATSSRR